MPAKRINSKSTFMVCTVEPAYGTDPTGAARYKEVDLTSYSSAGATTDATTRSVMLKGRRPLKGAITSRSVELGYNIETTLNNVAAQVAAFMWRKPVERTNTRSILFGLTGLTSSLSVSSVTGTTIVLSATATAFAAKDLIVLQDGVNDRRVQQVASVATTTITTAAYDGKGALLTGGTLTNARVVKVGQVFATGTLTGFADRVELLLKKAEIAASAYPQIGEWIVVGGDTVKFSTASFYARVKSIDTSAADDVKFVFDSTSRTVSTTASTVANVPIFFGIYIPDGEDEITMRYKRFLGKDDAGKTQEETFSGCFASEMAINIGEKSLINVDFTFIGNDVKYARLAAEPAATYAIENASRTAAPFNTSTDVVLQRLRIPSVSNMSPSALHGLVKDSNFTLNNNLTEITGNGIISNDGVNTGDVGASGTIDAYFVDIAALEAIRCNCTASLDTIVARANQGFVLDIPALTISGDGISMENNDAVRLSVTQTGFESTLGIVMSYTHFDYLPDAAMPAGETCNC